MKILKSTLFAALVFGFGLVQSIAQNITAPNSAELKSKTSAPAFDGESKSGASPINIGQVAINPSVYYRYSTGDNFRNGPGQEAETDVNEYGLRFNGTVGDAWTFSYSPSWRVYSSNAFEDKFSQRFNASGSASIGDWRTSVSQSYSESDDFLSETSQQTAQETWGTHVSTSYMINSSVSATLGVDYSLRDSEGFNSSKSTTFNASINRSFASRLNASLILSKGYENVNTNFDADFEQISGSIGYQPSDKIYVSAQIGHQERSFDTAGVPDLGNAIYSLALNYTPVEFTDISIRADSTVGASLFSNTTQESESVGIYLSQRLLGWVNLNLGYGESSTGYRSASLANSEVRDDEVTFFDARLGASIFDSKVSVSVFFRDQENVSDSSSFNYNGDQHGVEVGYSF